MLVLKSTCCAALLGCLQIVIGRIAGFRGSYVFGVVWVFLCGGFGVGGF